MTKLIGRYSRPIAKKLAEEYFGEEDDDPAEEGEGDAKCTA